jgi:hypothetical protein
MCRKWVVLGIKFCVRDERRLVCRRILIDESPY